jgi:polygalacturonase
MKPLAFTVVTVVVAAILPAQRPGGGGAVPPGGSAHVSIRQFGAAGDGSTDDTASIVQAFSSVCAAGGGTIDIPAGTYIVNPASATIPICSRLRVEGTGTIKVKADAGNYRFIFAANPPGAAVDDLTFSGITIDQNAYGNTTSVIDLANPRSFQFVWQVFAGSNLHFEGMHLYVSGIEPIDVNGPTVSSVYIARNHIVFQKRSGQPPFDNSAVYIDGEDFHVTDNTFSSTPADMAVTAIEVHTGSGSVSGNTIDHYAVGMNLADLHGASIVSNNIRNAGSGISLWANTSMDSVTVSGNTIRVAQVTQKVASAWGIATAYNDAVNGDFANLQISNNVVTFEAESASRAISNHVNYGIGLQTVGNISNVLVAGNEIVRAPVRGITIGVYNPKYTTSRVTVRDNRIVDAGSNFSAGTSDYSAAIAVQGNLSSVDVIRNRLDFLSKPFIGHYSYWAGEKGFTFSHVIVADNYATAAHGTPENGLTASVRQTSPVQ